MASPWVDGAHPQRTGAAGASNTGSSPRIGADAKARSNQLAQQFAAQIEMSMMQSLSQMGASDESDESGEDGEAARAAAATSASIPACSRCCS